MIRFRTSLALLSASLLAACASTGPAPSVATATTAPPTVLLLSIDGLRADMVDRGHSPNLARLAREGVRSVGM